MEKIDPKMVNVESKEMAYRYVAIDNSFLNGVYNSEGFNRLKEVPFISESINILRKHSSGINVVFTTDSPFINIKAKLAGAAYMSHMTAVATIGFDLYYKHKNKWCFLSTTKINQASYEVNLIKDLSKKEREYRLYFPLYQQVQEASLGIRQEASFKFIKEEKERLIIYGTSISQGGCASRPGLSYGALLGRWLDLDVINLGFSGSAHMEDNITKIINSIPHKYLILELEANNFFSFQNKLDHFLKQIDSPQIILISHFPLTRSLIDKDTFKIIKSNYLFQKKYQNEVILIDGKKALKKYEYEETVDGIHLNDLGFYGLAKYILKIIRGIKK